MIHFGFSSLSTHYEVLSVSENASYAEIREKYKVAILSSHPDKKLCGKSVFGDEEEDERFLSVQKAWEVLSDPDSRENYDNELQASRNEVEVVDNEIRLEDMILGDRKDLLYQCRCGDYFRVTSVELEELGFSVEEATNSLTHASVVLPCGSCSLKIRVLIYLNADLCR